MVSRQKKGLCSFNLIPSLEWELMLSLQVCLMKNWGVNGIPFPMIFYSGMRFVFLWIFAPKMDTLTVLLLFYCSGGMSLGGPASGDSVLFW